LFPLFCSLGLLGMIACSDDTTSADDANETTAASSTVDESDTSVMDTSTDAPPETDTGTDTASFVQDEGPDTSMEEGGLGMLGEMCQSDSDCVDELFCNGVPGFGGICSECASDADCPMGNCTFTGAYFGCGDGGEGQMCESDEVCAEGLFCAEVVDLGGLFNGNFCSECKVDTDCPDGQLCAPVIEFMDLMNISGQRSCIDPETAPNGQLCDADGSGDEQCMGFCTTADIMGLIEVGVCGECETDADCAMNMTCMPAMVGLDGFAGSVCG
jgi:hypothetical protein